MGNCSASKVFTSQTQEPEFDPQECVAPSGRHSGGSLGLPGKPDSVDLVGSKPGQDPVSK